MSSLAILLSHMVTTFILPEKHVRREVVNRFLSAKHPDHNLACGILHKTDIEDDIVDSIPDLYVAIYLMRGTGLYVDQDGTRIPVKAGDFIQRLPGRKHSTLTTLDGQWVEFFLVLDRHFFESLAALGLADHDHPVMPIGLDLALIERLAGYVADCRSLPENRLGELMVSAHSILNEFNSRARQHTNQLKPHSPLVDEARRRLSENLHAQLPICQLATDLGIGYERFRKIFKEQTGFSPVDYHIRKRIDRAKSLLLENTLSLKEIAEILGYPDVFSFNKQFRRFTGHPPGRFRAR